ncbi:MAG: ATP-binding cassette domain-containing protein, partial [Crocinitomicaceae bacterium]
KHFKVLVQQYGFLILFKVIIALALLIVGGVLVLNQQMNIGQFVAAEIIILLVLNSVEKLILNLEIFYDVLTAIEKIGQITDLPIEQMNGVEFEKPNDGVKVHVSNVSYQFAQFQFPVLNEVSFEVNRNERICFVSDSSLSVNVLFSLISGIYDFQKGNISINDIPISNISKNSLREEIGTFLIQDQFVNSSIYDNVAFGREGIDLKQVAELAVKLEFSEFVEQITDKFNAIINPERNVLPSDIATRILLARAFITNPSLLLLEDPTSGMNSEQSSFIAKTIRSIGKSTIIMSSFEDEIHQISDRIIEIKGGKIIFEGNYNEFKKR